MAELKPGWRRVKFGEAVRQVKDKVDPEESGLTRFIAGEHMDTDNLRIRRWGEIVDGYLGPAFHMRFKAGQVLYGSRRTYLRKVAVPDFEGICANTTFVLESANPEVLLPELLPFVMTTEAFHTHSRRESKGSVNPYVNYSDLAWYEFALPPLEEQRRIAKVLQAQEAAAQASQEIALAAEVTFDSYANAVFRGHGYGEMRQHSRLGLIASGFDVLRISDLIESSQYGLSTAPLEDGRYPILRMMNLVDGCVVENDIRYVDLQPKEFEAYRLEPGDVLFNRTNSIDLVGRTGVYNLKSEHVFASYLVRLRVRRELLRPEYLSAYLNAPMGRRQVLGFATKAVSQANVNASNLAKVFIPVPSMEVQDRIVAGLDMIRIAAKDAWLRAGLMKADSNQLFTKFC
jgi:type I restriction enzyme S subunit